VIIPSRFWEEIATLSPAVGLRELIHRHDQDVLEVAVEADDILLDIDDSASYREVLKKKT
jgi:molybdenum cofactor cytidylyltransferase